MQPVQMNAPLLLESEGLALILLPTHPTCPIVWARDVSPLAGQCIKDADQNGHVCAGVIQEGSQNGILGQWVDGGLAGRGVGFKKVNMHLLTS